MTVRQMAPFMAADRGAPAAVPPVSRPGWKSSKAPIPFSRSRASTLLTARVLGVPDGFRSRLAPS